MINKNILNEKLVNEKFDEYLDHYVIVLNNLKFPSHFIKASANMLREDLSNRNYKLEGVTLADHLLAGKLHTNGFIKSAILQNQRNRRNLIKRAQQIAKTNAENSQTETSFEIELDKLVAHVFEDPKNKPLLIC